MIYLRRIQKKMKMKIYHFKLYDMKKRLLDLLLLAADSEFILKFEEAIDDLNKRNTIDEKTLSSIRSNINILKKYINV